MHCRGCVAAAQVNQLAGSRLACRTFLEKHVETSQVIVGFEANGVRVLMESLLPILKVH